MKHVQKAKELLATALNCPWCAIQPVLSSRRIGHRDEPSRLAFLKCPSCGVEKSVAVTDSQETQASANSHGPTKFWNSYEQGCAILCLPKLLEIWNKRV